MFGLAWNTHTRQGSPHRAGYVDAQSPRGIAIPGHNEHGGATLVAGLLGRRQLAALRFRGFVTQDPTSGAYLLGPGATPLADDFLSDENLPLLLHPALLALCGAADEFVHLGVLSGTQVVYLDSRTGTPGTRVLGRG